MSSSNSRVRQADLRDQSNGISVCVPTFRRPKLLFECVNALNSQTIPDVAVSIIIVDNDIDQTARPVVEQLQESSSKRIVYVHEPEPNISKARNCAVAAADGDYIAFIDDDEVPDAHWLDSLYQACVEFSADGVLGPVLPRFEGSPPDWLTKSGLCMRRRFKTGTRLQDSKYLRTGNVLLRSDMLRKTPEPFDPRFGLTGGEDTDFFERMLDCGRLFIWCDEAPVFESVPAQRQRLRYHLHRALLRGITKAQRGKLLSLDTAKSIVAVIVYAAALPVLFVASYFRFTIVLVKTCDHLGKLLGHFGLQLER